MKAEALQLMASRYLEYWYLSLLFYREPASGELWWRIVGDAEHPPPFTEWPVQRLPNRLAAVVTKTSVRMSGRRRLVHAVLAFGVLPTGYQGPITVSFRNRRGRVRRIVTDPEVLAGRIWLTEIEGQFHSYTVQAGDTESSQTMHPRALPKRSRRLSMKASAPPSQVFFTPNLEQWAVHPDDEP